MNKQQVNEQKTEKSLDDYIKLAQEKTQKWPEWKRNMFTPASTEQKPA